VKKLSVPLTYLLVFALAAFAGLATMAAAGPRQTGFTPAGPGEPTYELRIVGIAYPFVGVLPHASEPEQADPERALVTYDASWVGSMFPGQTECRITAYDAEGSPVGEEFFHLTVLQRSATGLGQQVYVSEPPVSADGACARGDYASDASYSFERITVDPIETALGVGSVVYATARWQGQDPSARACAATVTMSDGTEDIYEFTIDVGDGDRVPITHLLPGRAAEQVRDVQITCGPITG